MAVENGSVAIGLVLGFYDGFFGPGTGSFFVFALVRLLGYDFLNACASAKLLNTATNLAALILFAMATLRPKPPPLGYPLCSTASLALRALTLAIATSPQRGRQGYGFGPCLSRPRLVARAPMRSPSLRVDRSPDMLRVSDRAGSEHGLRLTSCSILPSDMATSWACPLNDFAALWLACRCPLSTLRPTPRDVQRMTRGLSNSPFLPSIELLNQLRSTGLR